MNILDGGTSASSTTVADADRVVLNDDGTMVQTTVTDISTYMNAKFSSVKSALTNSGTQTVTATGATSIYQKVDTSMVHVHSNFGDRKFSNRTIYYS